MRILGDVAFTRKPTAHQKSERGTVAVCDVPARGPVFCFLILMLLLPADIDGDDDSVHDGDSAAESDSDDDSEDQRV